MTAAAVEPSIAGRTVAALVATEVFALGSLLMPIIIGLSIKVNSFAVGLAPETMLSIVTACGAVVAMVASPVFGHLSDRRRHGRTGRAPWVLGGVLAGAPAMGLVALAPNLPTLVAAWCLAQLAFNATFAGLYGLIADIVPEHDRARVSGWFGGANVLAIIVSMLCVLVLPAQRAVLFAPMPVLAVVCGLVAYRQFSPLRVLPSQSTQEAAGLPWRSLLGHRQFSWIFAHRLLVQLAYVLGTSFGFFFLIRRTGMDVDSAADWVALIAIVSSSLSLVVSIVVGKMSSRRGDYGPVIVIGMALMCVSLVLKAFAPSLALYLVAALGIGIGIGCYYAIDMALVLRTVPAGSAGRFLGAYNIARTLPQSLAPAIAPALLAVGRDPVTGGTENYAAFFLVAAVFGLAALWPLRKVTVLRRA